MRERKKTDLQIACSTRSKELRYYLYLPPKYGENPNRKWPVIFYLHGAGERGRRLSLLKKHGIPKIVESWKDLPFITVSPQCPKDTFWFDHYDELIATLNEVMEKYEVDVNRIYLTGNSMGGYGTWGLAIKYPDRFAAIAPICGGGMIEEVCALKNVPVWAFHGQEDNLVDISESRKTVDALKACGGKVRFTIYKGIGHDSWTQTYENPRLYDWFLTHHQ